MSSGSGHWPESLSDAAPQGRVQRSPQTPQLTAGCSRPAPRRHPPDQEANMGRPGRARRKSVRTLPCGQARCGRGVRSDTPCHRPAPGRGGPGRQARLGNGWHVRGGPCRAIGWCFTAGRRTPSPRRQPPGWPTQAFHRPTEASDTCSLRAASAIEVSPDSTGQHDPRLDLRRLYRLGPDHLPIRASIISSQPACQKV